MNLPSALFFLQLFRRAAIRGELTPAKLRALAVNLYFAWRRNPKVPYGPVALWVEPVNYCNLRCHGCWVPGKQAGLAKRTISLAEFERQIESLQETLILVMLQMSGEPLLHPDLLRMVSFASRRRIAVWTSTNGSYKTDKDWGERVVESGLDTLFFSISGLSQESYQRYHQHGRIDVLLENIAKLNAAKGKLGSGTPRMYFRFLQTRENEDQYQEVTKRAAELGIAVVRRKIKTSYQYLNQPPAEPRPEEVKISASFEPRIKNHCHGLWLALALKASGQVLPCCYDWLYPPEMGRAGNGRDLKAIWFSREFEMFRQTILTRRATWACCRYCDNAIGFKDSFSERPNQITIEFLADSSRPPETGGGEP